MAFEGHMGKNRVKFLANIMKGKGIRDIAINAETNGFQQIDRMFNGNKEQDFPLLLSRILSKSWQYRTFHLIPDLPSHKNQGVMK